jgi:UDP-2,4-diacetamido-2,4,6-trideoxy-beta-L-altropyranose hydrolase
MQIFFRADASLQIGTGHIMRCLSLADKLRQHGAKSTFCCRPHEGNLIDVISQHGHRVISLPLLEKINDSSDSKIYYSRWSGTDWLSDAQDTLLALNDQQVDWLVVDHYALGQEWEVMLRSFCQNLMVIDDLADRQHCCDLLLDQNLGRSAIDYFGLLDSNTTTLIGPQYALLRPEFAALRSKSLERRVSPKLKRLLIAMGGVDKDNVTTQVLKALSGCNLSADLHIDVVMGRYAPFLGSVQQQAKHMPWLTKVLVDVKDIAQIMVDCDLAIGGAGITSWERCCLGLPTMLLVLADNQKSGAFALEKSGAVLSINSPNEIQTIFRKYLDHDASSILKKMTQASSTITDGKGASRVVKLLMSKK